LQRKGAAEGQELSAVLNLELNDFFPTEENGVSPDTVALRRKDRIHPIEKRLR